MAATDATKFLNKTEYENALARIKSYIDGVTPTKLSELTDDIVTGHYLPLAGGTLTGPLKWNNGTALPSTSSAEYFLAIDTFASGGTTKYITAANLAKSIASSVSSEIGLSNYLPLSGGTMTAPIVFATSIANKENGWDTIHADNNSGLAVLTHTNNVTTGSPGRYSVGLHIGGYYWMQIANDRSNFYMRGTGQTDWTKVYTESNLTKSVVTTLLGTNTYAPYNANGYLPLSGGTLTGNLTISKNSAAEINIQTNTTGVAALTLTRGTQADGYVDWRMANDGGGLYFRRNVDGTWTDSFSVTGSAVTPIGTITSNISNITLGNSTHYWGGVYTNYLHVGSESAKIGSTAASNVYIANSSGNILVVDGKVVRRNTAISDVTLGNSSYPWGGVYSTSFVKDGGTASQFLKADGSVDATPYWDMKAAYHFANGYLVETSLVSTANQQIFFIIEGRQHGGKPFFVQGNAWYQSSGAVFASGHSFATRYGAPMGNITLFVYNGHICMWFTQPTSYCFFRVAITIGTNNRVTSITNSAIPSSASSKVTITPGAALADTYLPLAGGTIDGTLTVTGNTSVGGTFRVLTTGGTYAKFLVYPTNPYGIVFKSASNGTMTIQSQRESNDNETYPLVLNPSGGNVGVGTSSPSYKLDVNGTTRVSGISTLAGGIVLGTSTNAVAAKMEWDETNNAWKLNGNFYATGFVSSGGMSSSAAQYLKYVYLTSESQMPTNPDPDTLYLILES